MPDSHQMILVLDFGSQFTQLIARRIREAKVYCEIVPFNTDLKKYDQSKIAGYVLSGGPASVTEPSSPRMAREFYSQKKPILGICYGMQLVVDIFGGELVKSDMREYGRATFVTTNSTPLFKDVKKESQVWMSHGDSISTLPQGFHLTGSTESVKTAAMANEKNSIYGVQFHPEVYHTTEGKKIIHNFLFDICHLKGDWTTEAFIDEATRNIKERVGNGEVVVGVSGGIDSTVTALLISKAIGEQLQAVFVDTGLLRKNEFEEVKQMLGNFNLSLHAINASKLFLDRLKGVADPEKKRKIIGNTFIDVFEEQAKKIGHIDFLAQGTLYPDVIESVSFKGSPSVSIKSHHNVGGLKERMKFKLVEPLRELFKDEVRELARNLGVPEEFIGRHPFPGPGLAVRILGEITEERCDILREADAVFINELHNRKIYNNIWQAFAALLPIKAVGVMGDSRTYENVVVLRAVTSVDGMTADWARIDNDILADISNKIIRNVKGVNRVVYDISSKPPATIEWE